MADPLAQAMVLTSIVITMGVAAFVLALAYRAYALTTTDQVENDPEDVKVAARREGEDPEQ
jgi:multicomponent Na+:H+ antiporter subunit C